MKQTGASDDNVAPVTTPFSENADATQDEAEEASDGKVADVITPFSENTEDGESASAVTCKDVSGHYTNKAGELVTIEQTGCSIVVQDVNGTAKKSGTSDDQLHFADDSNPGFVTDDGDIFFSDGTTWHKATQEQADEMIKEAGGDNVAPVTTPFSENADAATASDLASSAAVEITEADLARGCSDFGGTYLDSKGKTIVVNQTECDLAVTVWADAIGENITKHGHVYNQIVTIEDFKNNGTRTVAGVQFADSAAVTQQEWFLADNGEAEFAALMAADRT